MQSRPSWSAGETRGDGTGGGDRAARMSAVPAAGLRIGPYEVAAPVVLAPMAGITNQAFRRLCREHGPGFYVSEMVTSRARRGGSRGSLRLMAHDQDERPRSVQLYGVGPGPGGPAWRMLPDEGRADH